MTGRFGAVLIVIGACLIAARAFGWTESNLSDLGGVLFVVAGALAVAVSGEEVSTDRRR
jgi:uncharacterized membrane protein